MEEIIAFAELGECIDQPVQNYSSGMKSRLGFATAIHIEPDVILIDEVLGVGDERFKKKSSKYMKEKLRDQGITAVLVSHSEKLVREICDRAVLIRDGEIKASGDLDKVFAVYLK